MALGGLRALGSDGLGWDPVVPLKPSWGTVPVSDPALPRVERSQLWNYSRRLLAERTHDPRDIVLRARSESEKVPGCVTSTGTDGTVAARGSGLGAPRQ